MHVAFVLHIARIILI